jgi:hypothetical protein
LEKSESFDESIGFYKKLIDLEELDEIKKNLIESKIIQLTEKVIFILYPLLSIFKFVYLIEKSFKI